MNRTELLNKLTELAQSGAASAVDAIMSHLHDKQHIIVCKKIDYVLSIIEDRDMRFRISHYLFNGTEIQRNYSALYFKRRGNAEILKKAYRQGCIDAKQAFSK